MGVEKSNSVSPLNQPSNLYPSRSGVGGANAASPRFISIVSVLPAVAVAEYEQDYIRTLVDAVGRDKG